MGSPLLTIDPETRTGILRVSIVIGFAIVCAIGAIRTRNRWVRIFFTSVTVLSTLLALMMMFIVSLVIKYGPR